MVYLNDCTPLCGIRIELWRPGNHESTGLQTCLGFKEWECGYRMALAREQGVAYEIPELIERHK